MSANYLKVLLDNFDEKHMPVCGVSHGDVQT